MKKFLSLVLVMGLVLCYSEVAHAQINRKNVKKNNKRLSSFRGKKTNFGKDKTYNSVGVTLNSMNYFGDLAPNARRGSTDIRYTRPAVGATFTHRFGPFYQLQGGLAFGTLRGDDFVSADPDDVSGRYRYVRNLHFRNRIKELSVVGVFDLFKNESTYISRVSYTPYAFIGLAVFHHNPEAVAPNFDLNGNALPQAGQWVKLRPLGTEGQYSTLSETDVNHGIKPYSLIQAAIPAGLGVRFRVNEVLDFSVEWGFRYLFTDYIDDVSSNYVDLGVLGSDLARAMSYRSDELTAAFSGNQRVLTSERIAPIVNNRYSYVGRDGNIYNVAAGFGSEHPENKRGGAQYRDIYTLTTVRLSYIIGATFHRAKFR